MAVREATKSSVKMDYCFRLLTRRSNRERICQAQGCKTFKCFTTALFVGPCLKPPTLCKNDLTTSTTGCRRRNRKAAFSTSTRDVRRSSLALMTTPPFTVTRIMSHLLAGDLHVNSNNSSYSYNAYFGFQSQRSVSRLSARKSATHYYDVLGLSPTATQHQIKSAYYKMSKLHHPDVTECIKSHALFTEVNEAYETLGNLRKRRLYDKGLFTPGAVNVRNDFTAETAANEDNSDYTEAYRQRSPFERGNRPPPPTGRSKIYNFDEFYRQHYGDLRERRWKEQIEYNMHKEAMEERRKNKEQELTFPVIGFYSVMFLIFGIILYTNTDYDVNRLPKTQTQSRDR